CISNPGFTKGETDGAKGQEEHECLWILIVEHVCACEICKSRRASSQEQRRYWNGQLRLRKHSTGTSRSGYVAYWNF
ncbi:unnamed protein product, partial [Staurois parvus]